MNQREEGEKTKAERQTNYLQRERRIMNGGLSYLSEGMGAAQGDYSFNSGSL